MKKKWLLGLAAFCISAFATVGLVSCGENANGGNVSDGGANTEQGGGIVEETPARYTVTYDANGGTFSNGEETISVTVDEISKLTAPESPTRKNYTFNGWTENRLTDNFWDFATDTVTEDTILYATWKQQSGIVLSVDGARMEEKEIFMLVDTTVESVSLANKVICSDDSTWKLYYDKLGQTEIPTKMAANMKGSLDYGDNIFYIVVTSNDGVQVNVYELNVYRSYLVGVSYFDGVNLLYSDSAYTGYEYVADYVPDIKGYTFNYWKDESGKFDKSVIWDALYLYADKTANTYTVTYDVNGGNELSATEKEVTYDSAYTLTIPTCTGYSFVGWYYNGRKLTDENGKSLAAWDIPDNATLTAKWQVNTYTVALNKDISSGGTVLGANDYDYDSSVTITANTNNGYVFAGWYNGDELLTNELSYTFQMPAESITYTAKWSAVPVTLVRNNTKAGYISSFGKYVLGDEITVTAYSYKGYVFTGWYNVDTLLTEELSYTFAIPTENVTYTATWEVAEELKAFDFTSTTTACTVTGLKDETIVELVIPDLITGIGEEAFFDNNELTSVVISDNVKTIEKSAFASCDNLLSVVIGNGVETVGVSAFSGCVNLTDLVIGENVNTIEKQAFNNCSKLTLVILEDKVTTLGYGAFYGCSGLKEIVIGDSVKTIGEAAFWNCDNIRSVYYKGTKDEWENITIGEYNEDLTDYLVNRYYYIENEEDVNSSIYYLCWHYVDGVPTAWETKTN